jgi:hypothetical protein
MSRKFLIEVEENDGFNLYPLKKWIKNNHHQIQGYVFNETDITHKVESKLVDLGFKSIYDELNNYQVLTKRSNSFQLKNNDSINSKSLKIIQVKKQDVSIEQYLNLCQDEISDTEYLELEKIRVANNYNIDKLDWIDIISQQKFTCYYCNTDLRVIQQLILRKIIKPRKRGKYGYSGLHFELDHKNAVNTDNRKENLVASCYYCNNDKSNTFTSEIFKKYFGLNRNKAFYNLFQDNQLKFSDKFHHNLKGKK